ncbi:MAG TPA: hypothetical protein PKC98_02625 [Candidatus Melainabacteria bacterium]|nr:hypothetical protein [Candidatus Melainabacteria bacterium]
MALFEEPSQDDPDKTGSKDPNVFDLYREDGDEKPELEKLSLLKLTGTGIVSSEGLGSQEGDNPNFLKGFELTDKSLDTSDDYVMDPEWNRLRQGRIPDCHFVASLQAVSRNPGGKEELSGMISTIEDPEGKGRRSWSVKFPGADKAVTVTEDELHPEGAIQLDESGKNPAAGLTGQWPSVLETAAGKLWAEEAGAAPYKYPAMQLGHCGSVEWSMELLTGKSISAESTRMELTLGEFNEAVGSSNFNKWLLVMRGFKRSPQELESVVRKIADKEPNIVFGRNGHAYTLVGYTPGENGAEGTFSLRNPWGGNHGETVHDMNYSDGKEDGILNLPVSKVQELFDQMYILQEPLLMR